MGSSNTGSRRRMLERTMAWLGRRRDGGGRDLQARSPAAFRAVVEERLRSLERQLDEVKGRVNGLIFLLVGAVAAQFVLRLVG